MIGHCCKDENGKYSGGKAGDQTGKECCVTAWYNRPWNVVLRPKDKAAAEKIARSMEAACANDAIGYDQGDRLTLYKEAKKVGFDLSKIAAACEADCSSLVAVCVIAAGYDINPDIYTGNERKALLNTGAFTALTEQKYLISDAWLKRGDVLLYENHHTAVCLTDGSKVPKEKEEETVYKTGWHRDDNGWWYANTDRTFYKSCWQIINRCWYYFNDDGYAVTGHQIINGQQYFFQPIVNDPKECALMKTDSLGALHTFYVD